MRWISGVLVAGLVATAAGCGGSDTLTKQQVIGKGTTICRHAEAEVNRLPQLTTDHPFAKGTSAAERRQARRFLVGYANALDDSHDGLAKLDAPKDGKQLLDAYLVGVDKVADELRAASTAPDARVEGMVGQAFGLFDSISKNTAQYGFAKGVCGSGSAS
jgi:hypothetical protein